MKLLKALVMGTAIMMMSQATAAQEVSGTLHPYWDEAETVPYFEEYGAEEESSYIESTCHRYEVPIGEEDAYFERTAIVPCDETFEGCLEERDDEYGVMGSTGTGPHYYNKHKHTCDPDLGPHANRVRIKSGSHVNAGTNANIWMCFGRHMEYYSSTNPDYDRPETLWYDNTPAGQDAACFNLGKGPSAPNTWVKRITFYERRGAHARNAWVERNPRSIRSRYVQIKRSEGLGPCRSETIERPGLPLKT